MVIKRHEISDVDRGVVLSPSGPLRTERAEGFREALDGECKGDTQNLIVDFGAVDYLDSTTLGHLLNAHDRMTKKGGSLILAALSPDVRVVIDSIGLTSFFALAPTVSEAEVILREGSDLGITTTESDSDFGPLGLT
ncbi:MAG: STAS domain-containing protein [Planctomycetes bacterium]|nr:STAS domain-containing protein [Planctomycetota bacterium]